MWKPQAEGVTGESRTCGPLCAACRAPTSSLPLPFCPPHRPFPSCVLPLPLPTTEQRRLCGDVQPNLSCFLSRQIGPQELGGLLGVTSKWAQNESGAAPSALPQEPRHPHPVCVLPALPVVWPTLPRPRPWAQVPPRAPCSPPRPPRPPPLVPLIQPEESASISFLTFT